MAPRLVVVGGGNMGSALVRGLLAAGWPARSVAVVESDAGRRDVLSDLVPGVSVSEVPVEADGAVLAVKPVDAQAACRALGSLDVGRVLSVMAGVRLSRLESWLGRRRAVLRAMPNTPALVGAGASAVAAGSSVQEPDLLWAEEILGAVGSVVRVREDSLDAVTGLSGSGPAFLFFVVEALIDAAGRLGLPDAVGRSLVIQTFVGSGRMLVQSGEPPEILRAKVTSPGGTTEAGLEVLGSRQVAEALVAAVEAAARRSAELGA